MSSSTGGLAANTRQRTATTLSGLLKAADDDDMLEQMCVLSVYSRDLLLSFTFALFLFWLLLSLVYTSEMHASHQFAAHVSPIHAARCPLLALLPRNEKKK